VGESVEKPFEYYTNNLDATFSLIRAMRRYDVHRLVFSSSATVYGDHAPVPYQEDYEPLSASSPYGRTKVMSEHVLGDVARAGDLKVALLRYFNPVGRTLGDHGRGPAGRAQQPDAVHRAGRRRPPREAADLR
jgi:UDP-glucose 4-epimerase